MKKLSTILCPPLLVFLIGWLGLAQPAEAQQTVTLSGRVTDSAGNAVSGATVELFRMPGWIGIDGQDTDGNGAYRLSASPGTYLFRVRPHGPFLPHTIEELTLSTNTTQNIVLETGVTLSGRVTGPGGQPAPGAWLSVHTGDYQEVGFNNTNESGHYSLGVPVGTYQIDVFSFSEDFLDKTVEGVEYLRTPFSTSPWSLGCHWRVRSWTTAGGPCQTPRSVPACPLSSHGKAFVLRPILKAAFNSVLPQRCI